MKHVAIWTIVLCMGAAGVLAAEASAGRAARLQQQADAVLAREPSSYAALFNMGVAAYWLGNHEEASGYFTRAYSVASIPQERAAALYNTGNALFQQGDLEGALAAYREGLVHNPHDDAIRYNYTVTKKLLDAREQQENADQQESQDQNNAEDQQEMDPEQSKPGEADSDAAKPREESKPEELSREDAMRLLRMQEEQEKRQMDKRRVIIDGPDQEKNW